jgi:hypothetical protein
MHREHVIQTLVDLIGANSYLELGVEFGTTFHAIAAQSKVAVDPYFQFDADAMRKTDINATYFQTTSDAYFGTENNGAKFDLIFVDGLHTFDQTLRDLLNAIQCLTTGGVIVVDDILPSSYSASIPTISESIAYRAVTNEPDPSWMGDVFRLVYFVESYLQAFSYACVQESLSQMVLWRRPRRETEMGTRSIAEIVEIEYHTVRLDLSSFRFTPLQDIMRLIKPVGAR